MYSIADNHYKKIITTTPIHQSKNLPDQVEESVKKAVRKITRGKKAADFAYQNYFVSKMAKAVLAVAKKELKIKSLEPADINLTLPPAQIKSDLTFSTFDLAKLVKKNPSAVASLLSHQLENLKLVKKCQTMGPYVNFELSAQDGYQAIIKQVAVLGEKYGQSDYGKKKVIVIDYSSPNIAKPLGINHFRSTIIGQILANILQATGHVVISDNHLGDWGTQFGKLIYAYKQWGSTDQKKSIEELNKLYVKFHQESQKDPELIEEARKIFKSLKHNKEHLALWRKFIKISLENFNRTYQKLGVKFDLNIGESYFEDQTETVINQCLKKGIGQADDKSNLVVVDFNRQDIPSFLLRKKDGSSLYLTRDAATVKFRKEKFDPAKIIYVVGSEQNLHFKQLFHLAQKMGYAKDTELIHVEFGLILLDGKKMSTRQGKLVTLDKLIDESIARARSILIKKNSSLEKKELSKVSEMIGIGAIIYNNLRQSREKNINFNWQEVLNFERGSSVYLQYTGTRIQSILKKLDLKKRTKKIEFEKEIEFLIAKKISLFPKTIIAASETYSPHLICNYLEELAQLFNTFYEQVPVINAKTEELLYSRKMLLQATFTVMKKGLSLLNIKIPPKM